MPRPSGMRQTPALASASGAAPLTCVPATWTQPRVGRILPEQICSVVDLPAPLGPSSAKTDPTGTARVTPCSTSIRP